MNDWWYFWSRQEWYWSALSFVSIVLIVTVMVCLCCKFFHNLNHPDDDDDDVVIIPRDPAPSLIIIHAQSSSENERILRHYDSLCRKSSYQPQLQYHSLGGVTGQFHSLGGASQHVPYNSDMQTTPAAVESNRPPPYAPIYHP